MREQEFGRKGVTDMLAPALVGQGVEIAPQEDLAELVCQGEPVTCRLVTPQALPDGGVGLTMLKHRTAQHTRRQREVVDGRAHVVGQGVQVRDGCPCDLTGKVLAHMLSICHQSWWEARSSGHACPAPPACPGYRRERRALPGCRWETGLPGDAVPRPVHPGAPWAAPPA